MQKKNIIIIVVIAVLLLIIYLWYRNKNKTQTTTTVAPVVQQPTQSVTSTVQQQVPQQSIADNVGTTVAPQPVILPVVQPAPVITPTPDTPQGSIADNTTALSPNVSTPIQQTAPDATIVGNDVVIAPLPIPTPQTDVIPIYQKKIELTGIIPLNYTPE